MKLSLKSVLKCFTRSSMPNVAYNTLGLQSIGFAYSMVAGLRDLYPDDEKFAQSCRRYAVHHNCHPFWGPFLTGAFLHTEARVAAGQLDPQLLQPLKETTLNSLSAIGDSFFSGSLEIGCFLIMICLLAQNYLAVAAAFMLIWLLLSLLLRIGTFYVGLSKGMSAVAYLRRFNLINLGDYIKLFNSIILLVFLALSLQIVGPDNFRHLSLGGVLREWAFPIGVLLVLTYLHTRLRYSRTIMLIVLLIGMSLGGLPGLPQLVGLN